MPRYDPYGKKFPRMSRQHFELIAYVISVCDNKTEIINLFCAELKETNRNFDKEQFLERCYEDKFEVYRKIAELHPE